MQDLLWNLDNNEVRAVGGGISATSLDLQTITVHYPSTEIFRMGFIRPSSEQSDFTRNEGASISLLLIVCRPATDPAAGQQRWDQAPLASVASFSREGSDTTGYWYRGGLAAGAPIFERLLGVDGTLQTEEVMVTTVADVSKSLAGRYWVLYTSPTTYVQVWYRVSGTGSAPAVDTGGTNVQVDITEGDSSDVVGAATQSAVGAAVAAVYTTSLDGNGVTFTAINPGPMSTATAIHGPGTSRFTVTLMRAGGLGLIAIDVDSYTLEAQFIYTVDGNPQVSAPFQLIVKNSHYRTGVTAPIAPSGTNVRAGVVAINAVVGEVTADASSDWLTCEDHGFETGQKIKFTTTDTLPAPLVVGDLYYIASTPSADEFTVESVPGAGSIDLTDAGLGTHTVRHVEQEFLDVNFSTPQGSANWKFLGMPVVVSSVEPPADSIGVANIVRHGADGFRAYFTGAIPDTTQSLEYYTYLV